MASRIREITELPEEELRDYPEWVSDAMCQDEDPEMFFNGHRTKLSKYLCERGNKGTPCKAKAQCLMWALIYEEKGVWGGTTDTERDRVSRKYVANLVYQAKDKGLYYHKLTPEIISVLLHSDGHSSAA